MNNEQKIAFEADEAAFGLLEAVKMHRKNLTKEFFDTRSVEEILPILRELGPIGYDAVKEMVFCSYYQRLPKRTFAEIGEDYGRVLYWLNFSVKEYGNSSAEILLLNLIKDRCEDNKDKFKEAYRAMPKNSWVSDMLLREVQKAIA